MNTQRLFPGMKGRTRFTVATLVIVAVIALTLVLSSKSELPRFSSSATKEGIPTSNLQPGAVASVPAFSSPLPRLLPQPANSKAIRPVMETDLTGNSIMHCMARGATSIWFDGSVPNDDYTQWDPLYVITRPGNGQHTWSCSDGDVVAQTNPTLQTFVQVAIGGKEKYLHTWMCPRAVEALYVTEIVDTGRAGLEADGNNFAGLNSIVYFTTKTGERGSFDMTTQTWNFGP